MGGRVEMRRDKSSYHAKVSRRHVIGAETLSGEVRSRGQRNFLYAARVSPFI